MSVLLAANGTTTSRRCRFWNGVGVESAGPAGRGDSFRVFFVKSKKTFDCVAMKHRAQKRIRAELEGQSREEEIAYFRDGAEEFQQRIEAAKNAGQKESK